MSHFFKHCAFAGVADFVPQIFRHPTAGRQHIEPLSGVVTRAGDWFIRFQEEDHPGLRIVNIQTVCLHVKDAKHLDTQQNFYMSLGDGERFLYELRFIRLIYARQTKQLSEDAHAFPRVFMKLFCPTQTSGTEPHSKRQPKFTGVPDMVGKIQEWISSDRPPIIGIETHGYRSEIFLRYRLFSFLRNEEKSTVGLYSIPKRCKSEIRNTLFALCCIHFKKKEKINQ